MKALSVKNPFAGLIIKGLKKYEVRSFKTSYRGELGICSTATPIGGRKLGEYFNDDEDGLVSKLHAFQTINDNECHLTPDGCLLGTVELVDVIEFTGTERQEDLAFVQLEAAQSLYPDRKLYLWVLENPKACIPVHVKGQLGIFNLDLEPAS